MLYEIIPIQNDYIKLYICTIQVIVKLKNTQKKCCQIIYKCDENIFQINEKQFCM